MRISKKRLVTAFVGVLACVGLAPLESQAATRPACTRARVGRTFSSGATTYRCVADRTGSRVTYAWAVIRQPTTTSASHACLKQADINTKFWVSQSESAWQQILNAKTLGALSGAVRVDSGSKVLSFVNGTMRLNGDFKLVSVLDDPGGPVIGATGTYEFQGAYTATDATITVGAVERDQISTTLDVDGKAAVPSVRNGVLPAGSAIPYRCSGNTLTLTERGADGVPVPVTYTLTSA